MAAPPEFPYMELVFPFFLSPVVMQTMVQTGWVTVCCVGGYADHGALSPGCTCPLCTPFILQDTSHAVVSHKIMFPDLSPAEINKQARHAGTCSLPALCVSRDGDVN